MTPTEFINSLYLGDRGCTLLEIDTKASQVRVHVDCLSRVREASGLWNYYTKEDVENAAIVFDEVSFLEVRSQGALPNDFIHELTVVGTENGKTTVEIRIGCAEPSGSSEAYFRISFASVFVVDPRRSGERITT